jgi:hypothetical protein
MPVHAIAGHLVVVVAPLAAVVAIWYAVQPASRRALRWPLVASSTSAIALALWAGEAAKPLLTSVKTHGTAAEVVAATAHAKGADALALSLAGLVSAALVALWLLRRPGRVAGPVSWTVAVALALSGLAVLATTWTTVAAALDAVWTHHPSWKA